MLYPEQRHLTFVGHDHNFSSDKLKSLLQDSTSHSPQASAWGSALA